MSGVETDAVRGWQIKSTKFLFHDARVFIASRSAHETQSRMGLSNTTKCRDSLHRSITEPPMSCYEPSSFCVPPSVLTMLSASFIVSRFKVKLRKRENTKVGCVQTTQQNACI